MVQINRHISLINHLFHRYIDDLLQGAHLQRLTYKVNGICIRITHNQSTPVSQLKRLVIKKIGTNDLLRRVMVRVVVGVMILDHANSFRASYFPLSWLEKSQTLQLVRWVNYFQSWKKTENVHQGYNTHKWASMHHAVQ